MKRYGLVGRSLGHSFSRSFFTAFFADHGIDAVYENLEILSESSLPQVLAQDFAGLNVTIPYKEAILPFLDELSEEAKQIGAVNVVAFQGGRKIGHNTDAYGFHQSVKPFLTNRHERALILGTGGASKAVIFALKQIGIDVVLISRNPVDGQFSWEDINEHMLNACKLVVNCTPLGTWPNVEELPEIPYQYLTGEHLLVDLVYNPSHTQFMKEGQRVGATAMNGESMLKLQALKAWEIWNQ